MLFIISYVIKTLNAYHAKIRLYMTHYHHRRQTSQYIFNSQKAIPHKSKGKRVLSLDIHL